jgi:hypothetical protein
MEKMFKYRMVTDNKCKRCGEVETFRHLLWECGEVKEIWNAYNGFIYNSMQSYNKILSYDDIFQIGENGHINKIKLRVIQEMIQIERPKNWSTENIYKIAKDIEKIEIFNSKLGQI